MNEQVGKKSWQDLWGIEGKNSRGSRTSNSSWGAAFNEEDELATTASNLKRCNKTAGRRRGAGSVAATLGIHAEGRISWYRGRDLCLHSDDRGRDGRLRVLAVVKPSGEWADVEQPQLSWRESLLLTSKDFCEWIHVWCGSSNTIKAGCR